MEEEEVGGISRYVSQQMFIRGVFICCLSVTNVTSSFHSLSSSHCQCNEPSVVLILFSWQTLVRGPWQLLSRHPHRYGSTLLRRTSGSWKKSSRKPHQREDEVKKKNGLPPNCALWICHRSYGSSFRRRFLLLDIIVSLVNCKACVLLLLLLLGSC